MANRRMFSVRITESTRFIKMPSSSQNLYFHLGMRADDDGVVEAYPIMTMLGATEDDLKILVAKQFVTVLNEDCVAYLNDWMEHNNIRADRKVDSIYKDLLLQIVPDACLKEAKPTYYSRQKNICQTNDGQKTDSCQHRIDKDRIDEDSLGKDRIDNSDSEEEDIPNQNEMWIPLKNQKFYTVPMNKLIEWSNQYPNIEVHDELERIALWLEQVEQNNMTEQNIEQFIEKCLSEKHNKAQTRSKNPFGGFTQNIYDFGQIEAELLDN